MNLSKLAAIFLATFIVISFAVFDSKVQASDQEREQLIEKLLKGDRAHIREEAATSLGYLADPKSIPALAKALKDEEKSVQDAAAEALEQINHPDAEAALSGRRGSGRW